jgi:hypothetical protein
MDCVNKLLPYPEGAQAVPAGREALLQENAILSRELGRVQQRCSDLLQEQGEQIRQLQTELMQARARCVIQESRIAYLQSDLKHLKMATGPYSNTSLRHWWYSHFCN